MVHPVVVRGYVLTPVSFCFSHGECPAKETTAMFIRLCEHFIEKNPTELIGKETIAFRWSSGIKTIVNLSCVVESEVHERKQYPSLHYFISVLCLHLFDCSFLCVLPFVYVTASF